MLLYDFAQDGIMRAAEYEGVYVFLPQTGAFIGCQGKAKQAQVRLIYQRENGTADTTDKAWLDGITFFPFVATHFKKIKEILDENGISYDDTSCATSSVQLSPCPKLSEGTIR